jgi:hypothetical protein
MRMLMKQVNKNSKSLLAKCMATEDIRVEHKRSAETAYFDTKNRLLVLPVWKDMSESIYDMLVAHEVSHALNTPADGWEKAVNGVKNKNAFHQFVNVVEDARIERMIKDKFPGIRRDFAKAYEQLHERDLFELAGKDIAEMGLIDRLNLEFKLGLFGHIQVPFNTDENQYVTRMAETVTFDDVVALAKDLYDLWDDEQEAQQDENGDSQSESSDGTESDEQQGNQGQSGDDQGESQDGSQSGSESEEGDEEGQNSGSGDDGDDDGEDSGQSQTDDTDDGDSADSGDGDGEQGNGQPEMGYDDYSNDSMPSETQSAFDNGLNQMVDTNSSTDYEYHTLPLKMNLENAIVDYHTVKSYWDKFDSVQGENPDRYGKSYAQEVQKTILDCQEFMNRSKRIVQHMVQQFMMRQAADADKRTDIAKTGILDTTTMINYRWSEDIFLKNETHTDGKNHGMVFFLDWSGSMNGILKDTVEQLLLLTEFCNKASIPFEVHAFSSKDINNRIYDDKTDRFSGTKDLAYADFAENATNQLRPHSFSLINFLSSKMKKAEYNVAVRNLYRAATNNYRVPWQLSTGSTPLNEAILCALDIVPAFQAEHGVQIVSTVFLTDGEGHSMGAYSSYDKKAIVHDPKTRRDFEVGNTGHWNCNETNTYLRILKDRTDCNVIGIRVFDGKHIKNMRYGTILPEDMDSAVKSYKKNNYCVASDSCSDYDEYFIIKAHQDATEDLFETIGDDMSHTKLTNAFKRGTSNVKSNRVIATKMVEIFAS